MLVVKKYLIWIIIGVLALGFIAFDFVYVGSISQKILKENQEISKKINNFSNFLKSMTKNIPTPKDLEIGSDYLENILAENKRLTAIWLKYASYLETGLKNGEVIYPQSDKARAGKPVPPLVFTDFLRNHYLQSMADAENKLEKIMQPAWAKMLTQSFYATNYRATMESAKSEVENSAPAVAAELAHIYTPNTLIPFKLNEDFQSKSKRWKYWRYYLVFKDIVERVIVNSHVPVKRDVVAFERAPADFDETTDTLNTDILRGEGERFIEHLSLLDINLTNIGTAIIEDPFAEGNKSEEDKLLAAKNTKGGAAKLPSGDNYHDVFEIKIEFVAHLKVVHKFMQLMLASKELYYVPISHKFERLTDAETMGNYVMPKGENQVRAIADAAFAETPANIQNQYLAFEHESPVRATFVYKLFRPRFSGRVNSEVEDTAAAGTGKDGMFYPGMK